VRGGEEREKWRRVERQRRREVILSVRPACPPRSSSTHMQTEASYARQMRHGRVCRGLQCSRARHAASAAAARREQVQSKPPAVQNAQSDSVKVAQPQRSARRVQRLERQARGHCPAASVYLPNALHAKSAVFHAATPRQRCGDRPLCSSSFTERQMPAPDACSGVVPRWRAAAC